MNDANSILELTFASQLRISSHILEEFEYIDSSLLLQEQNTFLCYSVTNFSIRMTKEG